MSWIDTPLKRAQITADVSPQALWCLLPETRIPKSNCLHKPVCELLLSDRPVCVSCPNKHAKYKEDTAYAAFAWLKLVAILALKTDASNQPLTEVQMERQKAPPAPLLRPRGVPEGWQGSCPQREEAPCIELLLLNGRPFQETVAFPSSRKITG